MVRIIYVKTNRAKYGRAKMKLNRVMNYTSNRIFYSMRFYNIWKTFDTYSEMRDYILENYELENGYNIPESRKEMFN